MSELPDITPGPCQSGAALGCTGTGILRLHPESVLTDTAEYLRQCDPCYDRAAEKAVSVRHAMAGAA